MVSASDGGVPKGPDEKVTPLVGAPRVSSEDDEDTSRKPSPTASDAYAADESITRVGAPVDPYVDDSVTGDSPAVTRPLPVAPQDDTESTTKKKPPRAYDDDSSAQPTAILVSPLAPDDARPRVGVPTNVINGMRVGTGLAAARAVPLPDPQWAPPEPVSPAFDPHPPRYDLRIAIVAFVSFAIPFALFLYLFSIFIRDSNEETPRKAAEVVSDPSPRVDEPRLKAPRLSERR